MNKSQALRATLDNIEASLQRLKQMGWIGFDCSQRCVDIIDRWGTIPPQRTLQNGETLDDIRRDLGDCTRCKLSSGRLNIVFGSGNPNARLVFVGEGPG